MGRLVREGRERREERGERIGMEKEGEKNNVREEER